MNTDLSFFVNKVCTVFLPQINRNFSEDQNLAYFIGKVLSINETGIVLEHPGTKCKTYFNMHSVIGIAEEKVVMGKPPKDLKAINPKPISLEEN